MQAINKALFFPRYYDTLTFTFVRMKRSKEIMILDYGLEKIVVERNDSCSDDSDSSSCSSYSGYEEIEIDLSTNIKRKKEESLPNPYIKLVRCDHLLKQVIPVPNLKHTKHISTRLSSRARRPRDIYEPDEYLFIKRRNRQKSSNSLKKKRKSSNSMEKKRKSSNSMEKKQTYSSSMEKKQTSFSSMEKKQTSSSSMEKKQTSSSSMEKRQNVGHANNVCKKSTAKSNCFINLRTYLDQNVKKEYLNDCDFEYNGNAIINGLNSKSTCFVSGNSEPPNLAIKEEPYDEYFDNMIGCSSSERSNEMPYNRPGYPVRYSDIDASIKNGNVAGTRSSENNNFIIKKEVADEDLSDVDVVNSTRDESKEDSSDSEVDVEKDWERPSYFQPDSDIVYIDHSYSIQQSIFQIQIVGNTVSVNMHTNSHRSNKPIPKVLKMPKITPENIIDSMPNIYNTIKNPQTLPKVQERLRLKQDGSKPRNKRSPDARKTHSNSERKKRLLHRHLFCTLRDEIPDLRGSENVPKKVIITEAYKYIKSLEEKENELLQILKYEKTLCETLKEQLNKKQQVIRYHNVPKIHKQLC